MTKDLPNWREPGQLMHPRVSTHILGNPVIGVDYEDTGAVESDFTVIERDEPGHAVIVLAGRYRNIVVRQVDGQWLIREGAGVSMRRRDKKLFRKT